MTAETDKTSAVGYTLIGVVITAGLSWLSANQTATVVYRQSCLSRIDAREALIRNKSEVFSAAQGDLIALTSHRTRSDKDYERRLDAVVVAGYGLSSYLDEKTYQTPKLISLRLVDKFYPNKKKQDSASDDENNKYLLELMNKWNAEYNALLASYDGMRKRC